MLILQLGELRIVWHVTFAAESAWRVCASLSRAGIVALLRPGAPAVRL